MKITSVPKVWDDPDNLAVCSEVPYHEDDTQEKCDACGCPIYLRPETRCLTHRICISCFRSKIKSGEIPEDTLEACFTDETRRELSRKFGREVSIGEMVDILKKELSREEGAE